MLQLEELRSLCNSAHSGVSCVEKQVHLALEPSYLSSINLGILKCLNSHLQEYYPEVSGILLGYENIKLKKTTGSMYKDQPHIHIDIQASFYIFCPVPGTFLLGIVNTVSEGHVGVLVHDIFNASILKSTDVPVKSWAGSKLEVGKVVKFKVVSVSYSMNMLVLLGDSLSMVVGESEVMVGIIEQFIDFERDSDHDSGLENGHKGKGEAGPIAATAPTAQMDGDTSVASGSKRKEEEEVEDEVDRKKKRKAEKKARKERARREREKQTLEASNNVDSSDEFRTDSKLKKRHGKTSEDSNISSILESDLQPPKTPKDKSHVGPQTPKTPKTPKDAFELPSNFKVIEHKTKKKSWKSYQGPDGKKFRSMPEVKKYLESTSNVVDIIEFVATEWNSNEHGDLATNVKTVDLKDVNDFPKTDLYFVDIKLKSIPTKEKRFEDSKVQEASIVDTMDKNVFQDEEVTKSSMQDNADADQQIKKKKKKKKNKIKDTSLE